MPANIMVLANAGRKSHLSKYVVLLIDIRCDFYPAVTKYMRLRGISNSFYQTHRGHDKMVTFLQAIY